MSHEGQLAKNTVIVAIGKISTQILSYILLPLFTARMVASEYGTYDFLCTVSLFLTPIITMLMDEGLFRFLLDAETEEDKRRVISQTIIYCIFGIVVFIPIGIIVLKLTTAYSDFLILSFIFFVISNVLVDVANAFSRGLSQIKIYSISNFILGVVTIILNILVLIFVPSAEGLLWANSIANVFTFFVVAKILHLRTYLSKPEKPLMKQMLQYSAPLVPNSISWKIINMSDRVLLTYMISSAANGIYAIASKFPYIITVLFNYFYTAWKESATKINKEKDKLKYYNEIYKDTKNFLYAVTLCLIAVMPFAFPILINKSYDEAFQYIPVIMIANYFTNLSSFYGGIFIAYKNSKIMGKTTAIAAIINLIIDLALMMKMQIWAACISTIVADFIVYLYRKYKLRDYVKLNEMNMVVPYTIVAIICVVYYTKYLGLSSTVYWSLNTIALLFALLYSYRLNQKSLARIGNYMKSKIRHKK